MDLMQYVRELQRQLEVAADAGGDDARVVAQRLSAALEPAARLVLLDALSAAAAEITLDLAPGSIDVRLRGRDPEFVVTRPPLDATPSDPAQTGQPNEARTASSAGVGVGAHASSSESDDTGPSRITLRLPEQLKVRIEEVATREGVSVNSWLVRTVSGAVGSSEPHRRSRSKTIGGQSFTGWVR